MFERKRENRTRGVEWHYQFVKHPFYKPNIYTNVRVWTRNVSVKWCGQSGMWLRIMVKMRCKLPFSLSSSGYNNVVTAVCFTIIITNSQYSLWNIMQILQCLNVKHLKSVNKLWSVCINYFLHYLFLTILVQFWQENSSFQSSIIWWIVVVISGVNFVLSIIVSQLVI